MSSSDTTAAVPTPFFELENRAHILDHMNADHADANLNYARHFGNQRAATAARLVDIDQNGIYLDATLPEGVVRPVFIPFEKPLATAKDAHLVLVKMAKVARQALENGATSERPAVPSKAAATVEFLRDTVKTALLGTVSPEGVPDASVAPVVFTAGSFYTYISGLALHTRNIAQTGRASVLLIEDEATATQLLARRRLTFACVAQTVERGTPAFAPAFTALKEKFGPVMGHLETMADFQLFRLTPERGRLVAGFGLAFEVNPADWTELTPVKDLGHARK